MSHITPTQDGTQIEQQEFDPNIKQETKQEAELVVEQEPLAKKDTEKESEQNKQDERIVVDQEVDRGKLDDKELEVEQLQEMGGELQREKEREKPQELEVNIELEAKLETRLEQETGLKGEGNREMEREIEGEIEIEIETEKKAEKDLESERETERETEQEPKSEEDKQDKWQQLQEVGESNPEQLHNLQQSNVVQPDPLPYQDQESQPSQVQPHNELGDVNSHQESNALAYPSNQNPSNNPEDILSAILSLTAAHHPDFIDYSQPSDFNQDEVHPSKDIEQSIGLKPSTETLTNSEYVSTTPQPDAHKLDNENVELDEKNAEIIDNPNISENVEEVVNPEDTVSEGEKMTADQGGPMVAPDPHLSKSYSSEISYESKRQSIMGLFRLSTQINALPVETEGTLVLLCYKHHFNLMNRTNRYF